MRELFEKVNSHNIIDFIKEGHLCHSTPCIKKMHHPLVTIISSNVNQFAHFFNCWKFKGAQKRKVTVF